MKKGLSTRFIYTDITREGLTRTVLVPALGCLAVMEAYRRSRQDIRPYHYPVAVGLIRAVQAVNYPVARRCRTYPRCHRYHRRQVNPPSLWLVYLNCDFRRHYLSCCLPFLAELLLSRRRGWSSVARSWCWAVCCPSYTSFGGSGTRF